MKIFLVYVVTVIVAVNALGMDFRLMGTVKPYRKEHDLDPYDVIVTTPLGTHQATLGVYWKARSKKRTEPGYNRTLDAISRVPIDTPAESLIGVSAEDVLLGDYVASLLGRDLLLTGSRNGRQWYWIGEVQIAKRVLPSQQAGKTLVTELLKSAKIEKSDTGYDLVIPHGDLINPFSERIPVDFANKEMIRSLAEYNTIEGWFEKYGRVFHVETLEPEGEISVQIKKQIDEENRCRFEL